MEAAGQGASTRDTAGTMQIHVLTTLDEDSESLLRMRALERTRDVESSVQQMRAALEGGKLSGACLYDDEQMPRGVAAWRWHDSRQTYAQVLVLYTQPVAPPELGESLVQHVFSGLADVPTLNVLEVRMRDHSPGVREAWTRRGVVFFERCRLTRLLPQLPIPVLPVPEPYRVTRWEADHQPQVEQVASAAYAGTLDGVVVPDTQPSRIVKSLRRLRTGQLPGVQAWNVEASLVVLDKRDQVVGYIAVVLGNDSALIADLAVHPSHLKRGLAQVLLVRSMTLCYQQGLPSISFAVTTRSPVRELCDQLGFQETDCGEVGIWWRDGRQLAWKE